MTAKERNQDIGALHLLAAFFVMLGHQCALTGQNAILLWGCGIQAIGVKIIFLLTGYLVTRSLWETSDTSVQTGVVYFWKRWKRIYPELFVCLIGTALVIAPFFSSFGILDYFSEQVFFYITANLRMYPVFALPGMFERNPYPNAVNGSLWTMPVEIALYVLCWVIYSMGRTADKRKRCYAVMTGFMIISAIMRFVFFTDDRLVFYGTDWLQALNIAPYFLIGGSAYLFKWEKYFNLKVAAFVFLSTSGLFFQKIWMNELTCFVVLSYFVLSFFKGGGIRYSEMRLGILKSEYCYGIYLWGFPVQQCMIQKLYVERPEPLYVWLIFTISVFVTYIIAMLSYEIVYKRGICRIFG